MKGLALHRKGNHLYGERFRPLLKKNTHNVGQAIRFVLFKAGLCDEDNIQVGRRFN